MRNKKISVVSLLLAATITSMLFIVPADAAVVSQDTFDMNDWVTVERTRTFYQYGAGCQSNIEARLIRMVQVYWEGNGGLYWGSDWQWVKTYNFEPSLFFFYTTVTVEFEEHLTRWNLGAYHFTCPNWVLSAPIEEMDWQVHYKIEFVYLGYQYTVDNDIATTRNINVDYFWTP